VLALIALDLKPAEAHEAVRAAQALLGEQATVEALVRAALKR
jgi:Holliday junction resolvasome RuvABC DNA-binding subunit